MQMRGVEVVAEGVEKMVEKSRKSGRGRVEGVAGEE